MKKSKLETIGYVDDQLVEKADKYTGSKKKNTWGKAIYAASEVFMK